jgi:phage terminase large subunit-like protein
MKAFTKSEKQRQAVLKHAAFMYVMLDGGSRSGKTFITIRTIIIRASFVKSRHVVLRLRFNAVKTSIVMDTLPKVWALCFPDLPPLSTCLNKSDWYVELPNGSQIWFAGLDDKERTEKILGTEYSTIYYNESSQIGWDSVNTALTRLAENSGLTLKAYFDCNPPTKKHWIYQVFYEGVYPKTKDPIPNWKKKYAVLQMNPVDNAANLPEEYFNILNALPKKQRERFEFGLYGSDVEGALWSQLMIDQAHALDEPWQKLRTVIGVDPAVTNSETSDEWGIGAASLYMNDKSRVDADYTLKTSTDKAADIIINAYEEHEADAVVVEVNQGGDLVENVLRLKHFKGRIIKVWASKGKFARAEPISALYEQNLVKHPSEGLEELETEMTEWVPLHTKESPNRLDWCVWALTDLYDIGANKRIGVL